MAYSELVSEEENKSRRNGASDRSPMMSSPNRSDSPFREEKKDETPAKPRPKIPYMRDLSFGAEGIVPVAPHPVSKHTDQPSHLGPLFTIVQSEKEVPSGPSQPEVRFSRDSSNHPAFGAAKRDHSPQFPPLPPPPVQLPSTLGPSANSMFISFGKPASPTHRSQGAIQQFTVTTNTQITSIEPNVPAQPIVMTDTEDDDALPRFANYRRSPNFWKCLGVAALVIFIFLIVLYIFRKK